MSNIHRLNEINENLNASQNSRIISFFGSNQNSNPINPRQETFCIFIKNFCCANFNFISFIFFISIIDVIMYILTLSYDGIANTDRGLLAPTYASLEFFGMSQGQIWRLVTSSLLHNDLIHLSMNMISQIIIGTNIEFIIGTWSTIILYFLSTIGGDIFSLLINKGNGVGASIAIFGLLGAYIGLLIMNWRYNERTQGPTANFANILYILFMILINFSFSANNKKIDSYGHLGGLITGFFLLFIIAKPNGNDHLCCSINIWKIISIIYLLLNFILGLCLLYLVL